MPPYAALHSSKCFGGVPEGVKRQHPTLLDQATDLEDRRAALQQLKLVWCVEDLGQGCPLDRSLPPPPARPDLSASRQLVTPHSDANSLE
jgi:hypothetical protein